MDELQFLFQRVSSREPVFILDQIRDRLLLENAVTVMAVNF